MSTKKKKNTAVSVSVSSDHLRAQVSEGALGKFGSAVAWLFPSKNTKVKIAAALAARVSKKIRAGEPLDDQDRELVSLVFDRQARAIANQQTVAERVQQVLPEVSAQGRQLSPLPNGVTSQTFVAHAESIASETTEEEIRDLFARVLAGELCRPGSFSLRTLEAVRMLDQRLAFTLDTARKFAFNNEFILLVEGDVESWVESCGLNAEAFLELQDAGLVDGAARQFLMKTGHGQKSIVLGYQDRSIRIHPKKSATGIISTPVHVRRLTRVGREIASVLPIAPDEEYFAKCGAWFSLVVGSTSHVDWKYDAEDAWRSF